MDITTNISSASSSWVDFDMTMGSHLLLDQMHPPYEFLYSLDRRSALIPTNNPQFGNSVIIPGEEEEEEELGAMKEMVYKIAAMQPVDVGPPTIRKPKRRNVRISDDPQSTAARHRRERISERISALQRLVPGGAKMDTASMLDEAVRYIKFLKRQVQELQVNLPQTRTIMGQVGAVGWHPVGAMEWGSSVRAHGH